MDAVNPVPVFEQWIAAINRHDITAIAPLMTPDHLFVDSLGNRGRGAKSMEAGWRGYFAMCPDYWIRVDKILSEQNTVLATGEAGGTIDSTPWKTPAAWQAVLRDGAISEWHVYADNKPVYKILQRRK
jgi:ketosteroid isomerase-like protein